MAYRRILVAALAFAASQALAQDYPSKPVRVIISFTPASATDIVGRVVTAKLSEYWGQPVVAENRAGAGGSIGAAYVSKAAPDGYTLCLLSSSFTTNAAIQPSLPFETMTQALRVAIETSIHYQRDIRTTGGREN